MQYVLMNTIDPSQRWLKAKGGQRYQTRNGHARTSQEIRSITTNLRVNKGLWSAAEALFKGQDLVLAS